MLSDSIRDLIVAHRLVEPGDDILVGVSGGPDSMCLLHILWKLQAELACSLHVAHLNHCLRGRQSDADAALVRGWCMRQGIPCTLKRVNVRALAAAQKRSLEDASRRARLAFFRACCRRLKRPKVALAHTRDDQAETVLMRLVRGTGITGLAAMRLSSVNEGMPVIRPLLATFKREILRYLAQAGMPSRVDASNRRLIYTRNRVRLEVIPLLKKLNPGVSEHLARLAEQAQQADEALDQRAQQLYERLSRVAPSGAVRFQRRGLERLSSEMRRRVLRAAVERMSGNRCGLERRHLLLWDEFLSRRAGSGKQLVLPGRMRVRAHAGDIIIEPLAARRSSAAVPARGILRLHSDCLMPGLGYIFSLRAAARPRRLQRPEPLIEYLDQNRLRLPLRIRTRKPGDVFWPLGAPGRKKLSDFFIDQKIDAAVRDRIPLVVSGRRIIWVVGLRIAEEVKITPRTKAVVRLAARPFTVRARRSS